MHQGFIKLHRRIREHWLYTEKRAFSRFEAWTDLIMRASHKDTKFLLGNDLQTVERGQIITSIKSLCEDWKWSNTKVRAFLSLLKDDEMITYKSTSKNTVINICNYSVYHANGNEENTSKTHQKHIKSTSKTHIEECKRTIKNDKEDTSRSKLKFETHHFQLAELLFREIKKNNPNHRKPNLENWANTFRLMMERDDREGKEIQDMIIFCQNHDFWHKNILSADKLRKQFDRLLLEKGGNAQQARKVARF